MLSLPYTKLGRKEGIRQGQCSPYHTPSWAGRRVSGRVNALLTIHQTGQEGGYQAGPMLSLPYTKLGILYNWHTHRSKYISIETTFQFNKETSTCARTRAHKNERERKRVQLPERPSYCAQEQNLHLPSHILFLCCTCSPHLSATSAELRRPEHVLHSE